MLQEEIINRADPEDDSEEVAAVQKMVENINQSLEKNHGWSKKNISKSFKAENYTLCQDFKTLSGFV